LGKNVCSLVGVDEDGAVVLRRRMRRQTVLTFAAKLPSCVVAMEACCGAHHLGRLLTAQGHTVKLMSPEYVRPYVKAQKNDDRDAEGIEEAASRPTDIRSEWQALDSRIEALNGEFVAIARHDETARRLVTIPGVGVLNATALVAAVGDGAAFRRGRDLGAWLGLVPKQHTTGGKPKLLGISKRGNKYLRMLFIHGARAAMPSLSASQSPLGEWLRGLLARTHRNIAIVALANKLARIAWATLRRKTSFDLRHLAVAG
jgi:transposase